MRPILASIAATPFVGLLIPSISAAHDVDLTRVDVEFRSDGRFQIDLHYDADAWIVGARPGHLTPDDFRVLREIRPEDRERRLAELRNYALRRVRIRFDRNAVSLDVSFPEITPTPSTLPAHGSAMVRIVRLAGSCPPGAREFDFFASRAFGRVVLVIRQVGSDAVTQQLLEPGERSRPYSVAAPSVNQGPLGVAGQYLVLGFEHIVPKGLDHILFVLGLFLLSARIGPLLWQVTAFTLAHSVSLALSSLGILSVSSRIVEPLIALSIAYVAIENILTSRLTPWRPFVVFLFGLLHGLGFAGVLSELGLPRGQFATALVAFNVGVEAGQASVILMGCALAGWFRNRPWYRRRVVMPVSAIIALTGLCWAVQRTVF